MGGDNSALLALMRRVESYAKNDPPENKTVECAYCGGQFVTAGTAGIVACLHCGAPVKLAKSKR